MTNEQFASARKGVNLSLGKGKKPSLKHKDLIDKIGRLATWNNISDALSCIKNPQRDMSERLEMLGALGGAKVHRDNLEKLLGGLWEIAKENPDERIKSTAQDALESQRSRIFNHQAIKIIK